MHQFPLHLGRNVSTIPGYYTTIEAAEAIGISESQCSRYIRDGRLGGAITVGNCWLIPVTSVEWFERRPVGNPNFGSPEELDHGRVKFPHIPEDQKRFSTSEFTHYLGMRRSAANAAIRTAYQREVAGVSRNGKGHYLISRSALVKLQAERRKKNA